MAGTRAILSAQSDNLTKPAVVCCRQLLAAESVSLKMSATINSATHRPKEDDDGKVSGTVSRLIFTSHLTRGLWEQPPQLKDALLLPGAPRQRAHRRERGEKGMRLKAKSALLSEARMPSR
jgi:hypothetical protein